MNSPELARGTDEDTRFDRLVDGELSPEEYQSLLTTLDDEPGRWRRCATAFLEAQALGQELVGIRREVWPLAASPPKTPDPFAQPLARLAGWQQFALLAACCLVALSLGIVLPDLWRVETPVQPGGPGVALTQGGATKSDAELLLPRAIGNARLVLSGPGGTQIDVGELPINEYPDDPSRWIEASEPALPASLISELERRGHRVERQEQYVPVDLEDGRKAVIPVEAIQISPVSRRAY